MVKIPNMDTCLVLRGRWLQVLDDVRERLPEAFDMEDIRSRVAELTPYIMVAIQVSVATFLLISLPSSV